MIQTVLSAQEAVAAPITRLGGKAYNLTWLQRHGFPVPPFLVLDTHAAQTVLDQADLTTWVEARMVYLLDHPDDIAATLTTIRQRIAAAALPDIIAQQLRDALGQPVFAHTTFFAVRSSVVGEDSQGASFAGQMDSFLFQHGFAAIASSYMHCLASAFSERAYRYRVEKRLPTFPVHVAVVVQTMIDGDVSGVLFTAHPVHGHRDQFLLSACYGAGEGIVSGFCATDEFTLTADGQEVSRHIVQKDCQIIFDQARGSGTMETTVEPAHQHEPCLRPEQLRELAGMGKAISALAGCPQDIEWTIQDGHVSILQTRPITTLPPPQDPRGREVVWDNSNIQESYCGVTTPLTFSFANRAYAIVYTQTMRAMNISEAVIRQYQPILSNMLGLIKGRVYYNINNWYACLLQMPSFKTNKQDMERMMGLTDPVDFVQDQELTWRQKLAKLPQLLGLLIRIPLVILRMDTLVRTFQTMFAHEYAAVQRADLHRLDISPLMDLAEHLHQACLYQWNTPIFNDVFVMMVNGRVHRQLAKAQIANPEALQNNLLAGESGIESTEPTKFLLRLCDQMRQNPLLQAAFEAHSDAELLPVVQGIDAAFHAQCLTYIEHYGDRTMGELKLESITLRQDPSFMFSVMRNFLKRPDLTATSLGQKEQALRATAEEEAFSLIRRVQGRLGLWRFKRNLKRLRQAIKNRENMRMARTRLFGLFRDIYTEVGQQLAFHGLLEAPRDIFYLTVEELEAYHEGRSVQSQLKPLVAARKAEFAQYEPEDLPHHFVTKGAVYHHNAYAYDGEPEKMQSQDGLLQGIGCYPGIVEEQVKLIFSPNDGLDLAGQILCTVRTDPGWAPLFPSAGGILVERGSTLSHSAVVARELGIPAVVGIPGLTKILTMGDRVKMDGAQGTVERLSSNATPTEG